MADVKKWICEMYIIGIYQIVKRNRKSREVKKTYKNKQKIVFDLKSPFSVHKGFKAS